MIPRGKEVALPNGALPEVIPLYLQNLIERTGGANGPIGLQFVARPQLERKNWTASDPLMEDHHEVAPGVVYKYRASFNPDGSIKDYGRCLWTVTRQCGAYCRYCTRGREVGVPNGANTGTRGALSLATALSDSQIEQGINFFTNEPGVNEVIVSGGDPLTLPVDRQEYIFERLGQLKESGKLTTVRIGTRLPIHNPMKIKDGVYTAVSKIKYPFLMVHINHPEELTPEAVMVLQRFKDQCHADILSQTVLLAGVNDNPDTLVALFRKMVESGVSPYYVFQNDEVSWAHHFTVEPGQAISLWQEVRGRLSGVVARARFVIDVEGGMGKVAVPEGDGWDFDKKTYRDFARVRHPLL